MSPGELAAAIAAPVAFVLLLGLGLLLWRMKRRRGQPGLPLAVAWDGTSKPATQTVGLVAGKAVGGSPGDAADGLCDAQVRPVCGSHAVGPVAMQPIRSGTTVDVLGGSAV